MVEAIRVRGSVCVYLEVRSQTTERVRDVRRGRHHSCAGGCGAGDVQQLATVSQHTTSATTSMRHLVAEIAVLREMRLRDTTTMVEAFASASVRSGSPGAVDVVVVRYGPSGEEVAGEGPGVPEVRR